MRSVASLSPAWRRGLVAGAVVALVVVLLLTGALSAVRDQDRLEELLDGNGVWGPVAYVAAFTALQPFSLPGAVLIIPATFVWSWWKVFLLTMAGGVIASMVGFAVARTLGQDWVAKRLPKRFEPWQARLERDAFRSTVLLRLVAGLAPPADWILGVSRISLRPFLAGTAVGLMPTILVMSLWGDDAVRALNRAVWVLIPLAVVGALLIGRRRRQQNDSGVGS